MKLCYIIVHGEHSQAKSALTVIHHVFARRSIDDNQFSKELHAFAGDHLWVNDHFESLLDKYAEQWIAVKNRRVIASDVDPMLLREKLADPAHTCVEFVTSEPLEMLL